MRLLLALLVLPCLLSQTPHALIIPAGAQSGPEFNAGKATAAYLATIPPEKKARSDAYFEGGYWIILWDFLFGAAVSLFLLRTRLSARLRDNAERLTSRRPFITWLYFAQYILLVYLLTLPLTIYEGFVREHR